MLYTLCDLLTYEKESRESREALVDGQRRLTYGALRELTDRYAALLAEAGVQRTDRVTLFIPRSLELVAALFAVWSLGAVAVIANDVLKSRQIRHIFNHSESTLTLSIRRLLNPLSDAGIEPERIVLLDEALIPEPLSESHIKPIGSDLAMIIYTSGSTGMPKGIMLSHANVLSGAFIISDYLNLTKDDVIISLLPFSFDYGLNQLMCALYIGGKLVIQQSVLPADICNTLLREKVTGMGCVPMLWQQLAGERSPFVKISFPHLRYITNTGGRMPEHVTRLFRRIHPHVEIYLMFGLTEAFRSTFLPPDQADVRPTSIGKPIPNVEIHVLNSKGEECGPDEPGELVHRGANIAMGYWRDPAATAQRFKPAPFQQGKGGIPEIAVYSGDYVKRDREGYLYFIGRNDQMIKSHGMRVSPEEIEDCVFASGLVAHAVGFSFSVNGGEGSIIAAVVPHNSSTFRKETLIAYCKKEMPEYIRPAVIWQLNEFPQTSSGKPDRVRIRELYAEIASDLVPRRVGSQ